MTLRYLWALSRVAGKEEQKQVVQYNRGDTQAFLSLLLLNSVPVVLHQHCFCRSFHSISSVPDGKPMACSVLVFQLITALWEGFFPVSCALLAEAPACASLLTSLSLSQGLCQI